MFKCHHSDMSSKEYPRLCSGMKVALVEDAERFSGNKYLTPLINFW